MHLTLAPLHGFTDSTFRNVWFRHFTGLDDAMAPFISLTHGNKITPLKVRELLPSVNKGIHLIPQILGNDADDFILLCRYLYDELGYEEVNWNLGCPIRDIVSKKRGSGLLPNPELIDHVLEKVIPSTSARLSVKLRLGYRSSDEFPAVIEVLNKYPLSGITVHPRIGIQLYSGEVLLDEFERFLPLSHHPVTYNGDIHSYTGFIRIRDRFQSIDRYMLGRGVFFNPFLPEMIRNGTAELPAGAYDRFKEFYIDLEEAEKQYRHYWISKMKEYWKYFAVYLNVDEKSLKQLLRCTSETEWNKLVARLLP